MCFMNLYEYTLMIFDMSMADMVVIFSVLLSIYFSRVSMYSRLCVCEKGVKINVYKFYTDHYKFL